MIKSILLLFTLLVFAHNRVICQSPKANRMRLLDSMTSAIESNAQPSWVFPLSRKPTSATRESRRLVSRPTANL